MNKELYYCNYWEHNYYFDYEMCVSDVVYSDDKKMAQIHIIVMKEGKVVRGISNLFLNELENSIREFIREQFYGKIDSLEGEVVKIWYYNIDDSPIAPQDVPLRIAITFVNSTKYVSLEEHNIFRQKIYKILQAFLNSIV